MTQHYGFFNDFMPLAKNIKKKEHLVDITVLSVMIPQLFLIWGKAAKEKGEKIK